MKNIWTRVGLLAAAFLATQLFLFGPIEIWARNSADLSVRWHYLVAVGLLASIAAMLPLAALLLMPARWRSVPAALLGAMALLTWVYSSLLFRDSLAIDGRDTLLDLASPLGRFEWPLLALTAIALAVGVSRFPRPIFILLCVLFVGKTGLAAFQLTTVRAFGALPEYSSSEPFWRFAHSGNVLAILLDGLQSDVAADELKKDRALAAAFEGFTFFKNATGIAPTTYPTMPTIHSGRIWDPNQSLVEQYRQRVGKESFLTGLAHAGYEVTLVPPTRNTCPEGIALCAGPEVVSDKPKACPETATLCHALAKATGNLAARYAPQIFTLFDMSLLRAAPFALKSEIYNSGSWLLSRETVTAYSTEFMMRSRELLESLAAKLKVDDGPPTAKFLHIASTHQPYIFDSECRPHPPTIGSGMENAARCSLRSVAAILGRLKSSGVYDTSTVVIFADHGAGRPSRHRAAAYSRTDELPVMAALANPVLMLKPPEARGALTDSMAAASVADIGATVCALTKACTAPAGRSLLSPAPPRTKRPFYWYRWRHEYWTLKSIPGVQVFAIDGPPWEPSSWGVLGKAEPYTLGDRIDFNDDGNAGKYLGAGWADSESWGTWTDGDRATVRLAPVRDRKADLVLTVQARGFVVPQLSHREVDVLVNDWLAGTWSFDGFDIVEREIRLPAEALGDGETLEISFVTKTTRSLAELGISRDERRLGIGIATATLNVASAIAATAPKAPPYTLGQAIDFRSGGNSADYRGSGWANTESWGTWTDGEQAILRLAPAWDRTSDLVLTLQARALIAQDVDVLVNRRNAGRLVFDSGDGTKQLRLPAALMSDVDALEIEFVIGTARSPAEMGLSSDTRRLGIGVATATLTSMKPAPYTLGETIDFRTGGNSHPYRIDGWTDAEVWGTWSTGDRAILRLAVADGQADLILTVRARAFVTPQHPRQEIDVLVNGLPAGNWLLESFDLVERELRLPAGLVGRSKILEIAFVTKGARSPAELGLSADSRRLGIGVAEATFWAPQ